MRTLVLLCVVLAGSCARPVAPAPTPVRDAGAAAAAPAGPVVLHAAPRLLSNQTSTPLLLTGERFTAGMTVKLSGDVERELPVEVLDATHAFARVPGDLSFAPAQAQGSVLLRAAGQASGGAPLTLNNDSAFVDLTALALSPDGAQAFATSQTDDRLYAVTLATGKVSALVVGDGPVGLSPFVDAQGKAWMVVALRFGGALALVSVEGPGRELKAVAAPALATGVLVDPRTRIAYVSEDARDTVSAISLDDGKELWRTPVSLNPRALALTDTALVVGARETGELDVLDLKTGAPKATFAPGPGVGLLGADNLDMKRVKAPYAAFSGAVMNGKAPRQLAWSKALGRLFISSIGPNIGPNPEKMEVSMNGGVGVADVKAGRFLHHLGFGAGVTEALALDDKNALLYATDMGAGLVRVLDARKLARGGAEAAGALLQELALPVPPSFPRVRPPGDFGVSGRAGESLHAGPKALALSADGKTLWVLNRFTGTLAQLDVTRARARQAAFVSQVSLADTLTQRQRRKGQVLYFADLGRTAMSCDACHLEGHNEGILFEKTQPLRIYRSTTVLGSVFTAPHFTPPTHDSMAETAKIVGSRNRYQNPQMTPDEIDALSLYAYVPTPPNPFVGPSGAPPERFTLPDGQVGEPRNGLALFEGAAGCVGCHPAPLFTTDQLATRGKLYDVGTPHLLPLRPKQQDPLFKGFAAPSLLGSWDVFPLFTTGSAGLAVQADGRVTVSNRWPLREAVEKWAPTHGHADLLTPQERNDLLAFLMML